MKIKEFFETIKQNTFVQEGKNNIRPTWTAITKGKGLNIFLLSLLFMWLLVPLNWLVKIITKILGFSGILSGFSTPSDILSTFKSFKDADSMLSILGFGYGAASHAIGFLILFLIISVLLSIIYILVTIFFVPCATIKSTEIFSKQNRAVTCSEYFKCGFSKMFNFGLGYFIHVIFPVAIVNILGWILNLIPGVYGTSAALLVTSFLYYALVMRYVAIYLDLDGDSTLKVNAKYWISFGVISYVIYTVFRFTIVNNALEVFFMILSVLVLTNSKFYYNDYSTVTNDFQE